MSARRIVIVGGGVASASAVEALRYRGFADEIVMVSDDNALPYERPPLSKSFLSDLDAPAPSFRSEQWYEDRDVTVLLGTRATSIEVADRKLEVADGTAVAYDSLLLATGVRARRPLGSGDDRILHLRSLADARQLRSGLAASEHVVVLGGGFIGCEIAATVVGMGKRVTIVERAMTLMERALGPTLGRVLTDVHRGEGVDVRLGEIVLGYASSSDAITVRTDRGSVSGDLVVVGAGSEPNDELAAAAGIDTGNGVLTDEWCRTSAPDVYAVGDVAQSYHPFFGRHLRVEHHDTAVRHGAAAAGTILGGNEPFCEPHWFWSDQFDHSIQQVGWAEDDDQMVLRGSLDDLNFSAAWIRDGRIRRIIAVNRPRDVLAVRRLLFHEHDVRAEELADPSFDMGTLVPRATSPVRG